MTSDTDNAQNLPGLTDLLAEWMPRQRWFAGKGRPLESVRVVDAHTVSDVVRHVIVQADYADGPPERYQVPVTRLDDYDADRNYARIAPPHADPDMGGPPYYYDALNEHDGTTALFDLIRQSSTLGTLRGTALSELD